MPVDDSQEIVRELLHAVDGIALRIETEPLAISYVSDEASRLGWPTEAWTSETFWTELLHPADAPGTRALFRATARDGKDRRCVHRIRTSSGEFRWFSTRVRASRREDGTVKGLVALMLDITDARGVSGLLRERDLFRMVLDQLPAAVYTTDCELRITSGAGAAITKLGVRTDQLLGVSIAEYLQTDDADHQVLRYHRRAIAGEEVTYDHQVHGVIFETTLTPLRDETGRIIGTLGVARDVTELRHTDAERAEHEARLKTLGEVSFEALALHEDGRLLLVNEAFCRLFGLSSPEYAVGRDVLDFAAPESRDVVARNVFSHNQNPYDAKGLRADGTTFDATIHSRDTRYKSRPVRVTSVRDMTVRKRNERQLRHRAAEWEAVLRSIADGVVVFDRHGKVTFVNESGIRATGEAGALPDLTVAQREQMVNLEFGGAEGGLGAGLSRVVLRGETFRGVEVAYTGASGRRRFARISGAPIRVGGECVGGVLVAHDITKMKEFHAERERLLREVTNHAMKTQSVLDQLVDGVMVVTPAGAIEFVNREARRLLALPDGHVSLDLLRKGSEPDEPHPAEIAARRAFAGEVCRNLQFQVPNDGGWRFLRVNAGPIRDVRGEVRGAVVVVRDVSDIIDFEEMKDQFIRVAAHELKTPVAVMKGYAQLLLRGKSGAARGPLEAIDRGAQRINRVVQELLDVSQLRLGTLTIAPQSFDLAALVRDAVNHTPRTSRHRISIASVPRARVRGDRHRLEFVTANLLDNAVRYSPDGGDIDVSVDIDDGFAVVTVRDHGVGIAREKQPRIFERFYRAHTDTPYDYGGIGVALALSREIVMRHGGSMTFESAEGVGSSFSFRVPLGGDDGSSKRSS